MLTLQQFTYFNKMEPGNHFVVQDAKDPSAMIEAAKEYIDAFGSAEFNQDYTIFTKLNPIPPDNQIHYFLS